MKIKEMKTILSTNKFDNVECNFKLKSKGPSMPSWFKEFADIVITRLDKIENRLSSLETRIDNLENRLDRIVKLNNLKE